MPATPTDALIQAIVVVWNQKIKSVGNLPALEDTEKVPGANFPYAVVQMGPPEIVSRMSGHTPTEKHLIYEVPVSFRIHTRSEQGASKSAKASAAELGEEVLKAYGGHQTTAPPTPQLATGQHLNTQILREYGVWNGDQTYQWNIEYLFVIDMPIATG